MAIQHQSTKRIKIVSFTQTMQAALSTCLGTCMFCHVFGLDSRDGHDWRTCPTLTDHVIQNSDAPFSFFKPQYSRATNGPVCFYCHVPQDKGRILHRVFSKDPTQCRYRDILAPTLFSIIGHNGWLKKAQTAGFLLGIPLGDQLSEKTLAYLGSAASAGQCTKLAEIFIWYIDHCTEGAP